jgi:hypothetical protein
VAALRDSEEAPHVTCAELRRSMLRARYHKKDKELLEVLEMRHAGAKSESAKTDFKLALAFAHEDLDALFAVLLNTDAQMHSRRAALYYVEASEKPEVVERLQKSLPKFENPSFLALALDALHSATRRHLTAEKRCEMALAMLQDKESRKQVRLWAIDLLTEHAAFEMLKRFVDVTRSLKDADLYNKALSELKRRLHWGATAEQRADMGVYVYTKLGERAAEWIRSLLLDHAERKLAQRLADHAKQEKDQELKAYYEYLTREVIAKYQEMEKEKARWNETVTVCSLRWLHYHQDRPSGMWDANGFHKNCDPKLPPECDGKGDQHSDLKASALATLAFLDCGETHRTGTFKKTISLALKWLIGQMKSTGSIGDPGAKNATEAHAIATEVLCCAYAMTDDFKLLTPAQQAVDFLAARQTKAGGWKKSSKAARPDAVTTAFAVIALKAAKVAKLKVPDECFVKALLFFDTRNLEPTRKKAGILQLGRVQSAAAAAIGSIWCGRRRKDRRLAKLIELLEKNPPKWDDGRGPVYWYLATYAMFQYDTGDKWKKWAEIVKEMLLSKQRNGGCADGSWDPVAPDGKELGRVGMTALGQLTLQFWHLYRRAHPEPKKDPWK